VKRPDGGYHFKKHLDWMKVKPLETVDLEITGVREGTGKYKGMLGALEMKYKGQDVRAGTGFSDKERKEFWKHQKKIIGQIGEFEFMEETDDGKTRHAVFVRIRSYKGEKA
jgi:DNA ligase-1